ncbi:MAG: hypothetical protein WAW46_15140, partial [Polaromonas sp.]
SQTLHEKRRPQTRDYALDAFNADVIKHYFLLPRASNFCHSGPLLHRATFILSRPCAKEKSMF